jgi:hypothetical protein
MHKLAKRGIVERLPSQGRIARWRLPAGISCYKERGTYRNFIYLVGLLPFPHSSFNIFLLPS